MVLEVLVELEGDGGEDGFGYEDEGGLGLGEGPFHLWILYVHLLCLEILKRVHFALHVLLNSNFLSILVLILVQKRLQHLPYVGIPQYQVQHHTQHNSPPLL